MPSARAAKGVRWRFTGPRRDEPSNTKPPVYCQRGTTTPLATFIGVAVENPNAPKWILQGPRSYASRLHSVGERLRQGLRFEDDDRVLQRDADLWLEELLGHLPEVPKLADRIDWRLLEKGSQRGVALVVPFEGDPSFFDDHVTKSPHEWQSPRLAFVKDQELTIELTNIGGRPEGKDAAQMAVDRIASQLDLASAQYEIARTKASKDLESAIRRRREEVVRHRSEVEGLGIPIRVRDDAPKVFKDPGILRRPSPVASVGSAEKRPPEFKLSDGFFEHINAVIRSAGRAMSASPKTYADWNEEDRRQMLLLMLNTHYEGEVFAEAFNASGKTDLLVRHQGRNLYVAECKIWSGPKQFSASIDQLFGYATWEDVKLGLIIFVESRALSEVIAKAKHAVAAHPQFRAFRDTPQETELRAVMKWPGDDGRQVAMQVSFVHVPK